MSVNYTIAMLNSRLQLVANAIDAGGGNGFLKLLDAGGNTLSSLQLSRPMGIVANGVLTFNGMSLIDPAAAAGGRATGARCQDSAGNVVISGLIVGGTVGGPTPDIYLTPTNVIVAGQTVAITTATITGN